MRRNIGELPQLVRLASEWGVGALWVQNLSHSFSDTDPSGSYAEIREYAAEEALWNGGDSADVDRLFLEAQALAERLGVELRLPNLEDPPPKPRDLTKPACHWPFTSAYITHEGKVQPCCMVMGSD